MTNHVFITHAVEDKKTADLVCEALESNGIQCWYAPRDVPYGMNFEDAIVDAICASSLMILILSTHSNDSPHVKREIQNACMEDAQTPILPFRIEDIRLNKALRYYLGSTQWLDASIPPLDAHLEHLVKRVREYLAPALRKTQERTGQPTEDAAAGKGLMDEKGSRREAESDASGKSEAEDARQLAEAAALARQLAEEEEVQLHVNTERAVRRLTEETPARIPVGVEPTVKTAEERALRIETKGPHLPAVESSPLRGFEQFLERPNRRFWYVSGGATLALLGIIFAVVSYTSRQNGPQALTTIPAEANSPRTDQVSSSQSSDDANVTRPLANSTTATSNTADPRKRASPVSSPTTVKPSPSMSPVRTATNEERPVDRTPISGGVLNGKASSLPKPTYPAIARAAHASGTVTVQVLIDENGNVTSAHAVSGHPLLQAAAVEAARQAKFARTTLSGQPVKVTGVIQYNFVAQ
ncbi:MAG TPA: TonB family protein [Pyrinomonadaceae bacterium]|jgi:TonB family C-terminal domain|nr:TonB family protein [Pyrinomonadaceae bacterium]